MFISGGLPVKVNVYKWKITYKGECLLVEDYL